MRIVLKTYIVLFVTKLVYWFPRIRYHCSVITYPYIAYIALALRPLKSIEIVNHVTIIYRSFFSYFGKGIGQERHTFEENR